MCKTTKLKLYLIVERTVNVTLASVIVFVFIKALCINKYEIKGGPTYIFIALLVFVSFSTIYNFIKDIILVQQESMPWYETLMFVDRARDKMPKFDKKAFFFLPLGFITFGTLYYTSRNNFILLLLIMQFHVSFGLVMRFLKFGDSSTELKL